MKKQLGFILSVLLAPSLHAQSLFINDATVHTQTSKGVLQNTDVLIRNGLVHRIGDNLDPPADAEVIEAAGRPLTPGFFAGVGSLGLVEIGAVEATADSAIKTGEQALGDGFRPEFDVTPAYNPNSSLVPVTRIEGFTWAMLGAQSNQLIGGRGRAVALDGGYDSFISPFTLFINVGGDASGQSGGSRAAQWMLLRQALEESQSEDPVSSASLLTRQGRNAMQASINNGIVAFDADRASDILQVIRFSQKHDLNTVIMGGTEAWMVADQLAEAGIPVLLNALSNLPSSFDELGARLDNAALLHEAGVTISFIGSEAHQARKLRQAAGNAVANGLPHEAAMAALTTNPALIFNVADNIGGIAKNMRADVVLWSGDPLEVTTAADLVIIKGKKDPMVSRQTLLRDRYLPESPERARAYIKP